MQTQAEALRTELEKVIVGKHEVLGRVLMAFFAGGHILLDDVPGVGKTTLATALSRATDLVFHRIQLTPDVMPSDLTGFSLYDKARAGWVFRPGVLLGCHLLLADEINRTSAKTQSALLEAMEEGQVTADGETYPLEQPFTVMATENMVGTAGTQPLPFAQMDRFMVRLSMGYPDFDATVRLLRERQASDPLAQVRRVMTGEDVKACREEAARVHAEDSVLSYATALAFRSREDERVEVGLSPRAVLHLVGMARARAWFLGRDYVTGADVADVFPDTACHRLLLTRRARAGGATAEGVVGDILTRLGNPDRYTR